MAVNLLGRASRARAREVLESSFAQYQADRGVVELAAEARRMRRSLTAMEEQMTCHLGDFREYARLRQRVADAEADLSRTGRTARREEAARAMTSLSRGDIIIHRRGRRHKHAIVLDQGVDRTGAPILTVLGEDSRVLTLSPDTAPEGVVRVGSLKVAPGVNVRRPRDRKRLTERLVSALRSGDLEHARPGRHRGRGGDGEQGGVARVKELRHRMRAHPCHACPDREEHARTGRRWLRACAEAERLQARVESRTGTIARLFDAVCEVLIELGYLQPVDRGHPERDLRVTDAGRMLARVYAERDLLVSECLRHELWDGLASADLAAAVSACVYEPRLAVQSIGLPVAPSSRLGAVLREEIRLSRAINNLESLVRIESSSGAEPALAGAVRAWAEGADLAEVLQDCELTAGDFVRWSKQLLDVLGQLARLTMTEESAPDRRRAIKTLSVSAARASLDVNRGVVGWSPV